MPTSSNALLLNYMAAFLFMTEFTRVTFYIHILDTIGLYNLKHKVKMFARFPRLWGGAGREKQEKRGFGYV